MSAREEALRETGKDLLRIVTLLGLGLIFLGLVVGVSYLVVWLTYQPAAVIYSVVGSGVVLACIGLVIYMYLVNLREAEAKEVE